MAGAIAGAFRGVEAIKKNWREKVNQYSSTNQEELAQQLTNITLTKMQMEQQAHNILQSISC
jgi:hypothetical protein